AMPRADLRREGLRLDRADAGFGLHAGGDALVTGELGLVEARLEIAEHRVERAAFDPDIKLLAARRVMKPFGIVAIDGVIRRRIDRTEQRLILFLLRAVVRRGQQEAAENAALDVERGARILAEVAVERVAPLHVVRHAARAQRALGEANESPRLIARLHPRLDVGFTRGFAIGEGETGPQGAADHRRGKLDPGDPVVAFHHPTRARSAEARKLAALSRSLRTDRLIGPLERERTGNARMDGASVAIEELDREKWRGDAVGYQARLIGYDFRHHRRVGEEDLALERRLRARSRQAHRELGGRARQAHAAPLADRILAIRADGRAFVGKRIDRSTIRCERGTLARAMPYDHANGGRARVVAGRGEQDFVGSVAERQPVDAGAGRLLVGQGLRFDRSLR